MKSVHHFPDKGAFFMKSVTLRRPALREELRRYLLAFLLGFGSLLVVILPIIIADGGYYIYYGDYNSQQIPFYNLANDAVRSGSFGWNWYTDLGVNFIGSYASHDLSGSHGTHRCAVCSCFFCRLCCCISCFPDAFSPSFRRFPAPAAQLLPRLSAAFLYLFLSCQFLS